MSTTSLKPRGNEVHDVLKLLKNGFDDPSLSFFEPTLYRQAMLSDEPMFAAWRGEILHQLALRAERRGDISRAFHLYRLSHGAFRGASGLGPVRQTRDFGMMLCRNGEPNEGLRRIHEALELHADDKRNAKGARQLRVTEGYELRARVHSGDTTDDALDALIEVALQGCSDFCLRDQYFLVDFARRYSTGALRRSLDLRRAEIARQRGRMLGTVTSIANVVIDTHVIVAGKVFDTVFRKE